MLVTKCSLLLLAFLLAFAHVTYAYTLQEAVDHTLATSPDFLISTSNRDVASKRLRESYAGYLPTLDMMAGWGEQYTNNSVTRAGNPANVLGIGIESSNSDGTRTLARTDFSLIASQMLFDGMGVYHDVQGHKAQVRAESWRVNSSAQEIALGAVEAFLEVGLRRELLEVTHENLRAHERIYLQIQRRSEGGISRKADLDQAEARLAYAHTNLITARSHLRDAETEFYRRIGIPVPHKLARPDPLPAFPTTEHCAMQIALKNNPFLHASLEEVAVAREAQKGARSPFVPRVDLQLGMTRNHNLNGNFGDSNDASAMLRMRWNLFSGGKDLARIGETAAQQQKAQEIYTRAHRQVVENIRLAWTIYETAKQQIPYFKEHVDASIKTRDAYQKQFNIGQRTLLDSLDSENELFRAYIAYINGQYTIWRGMFSVLSVTGQLTHQLGVALPAEAEPRPSGVMAGRSHFFQNTSTLFDN